VRTSASANDFSMNQFPEKYREKHFQGRYVYAVEDAVTNITIHCIQNERLMPTKLPRRAYCLKQRLLLVQKNAAWLIFLS